jgi:hypothetical protein
VSLKKERTTLYLDKTLKAKGFELAKAARCSLSAYIEDLIEHADEHTLSAESFSAATSRFEKAVERLEHLTVSGREK